MTAIRVLIVDDHRVVRAGLAALLAGQPDIVVAGEEGSAEAAIATVESLKPAVVITDLRLGEGSGIDVCRAAKLLVPGTRVIVLSAYWDDRLVRDAFRAGADGYLLKHAESLDIVAVVRTVASGASVVDPELLPALLPAPEGAEPSMPSLTFSGREREVMRLLARGFTNRMMAADMHLSPHTVKEYVSRLLEKLGAANRTELVTLAAARGLVEFGQGGPPAVHR